MSVTVTTGPTSEAGVPTALFDTGAHDPGTRDAVNPYASQYAVAADGQRFLFTVPVEEEKPAPIQVMVNGYSGLAARETR